MAVMTTRQVGKKANGNGQMHTGADLIVEALKAVKEVLTIAYGLDTEEKDGKKVYGPGAKLNRDGGIKRGYGLTKHGSPLVSNWPNDAQESRIEAVNEKLPEGTEHAFFELVNRRKNPDRWCRFSYDDTKIAYLLAELRAAVTLLRELEDGKMRRVKRYDPERGEARNYTRAERKHMKLQAYESIWRIRGTEFWRTLADSVSHEVALDYLVSVSSYFGDADAAAKARELSNALLGCKDLGPKERKRILGLQNILDNGELFLHKYDYELSEKWRNRAARYEQTGDMLRSDGRLGKALRQYDLAQQIYFTSGRIDECRRCWRKIEAVKEQKPAAQVERLRRLGAKEEERGTRLLETTKITKVLQAWKKAKFHYTAAGLADDAARITDRIAQLVRAIELGAKQEDRGYALECNGEPVKAVRAFRAAEKSYKSAGLSEDAERIAGRIEGLKQAIEMVRVVEEHGRTTGELSAILGAEG